MLAIAVVAAVTGAASTAGAWAFNSITHLRRRTEKLQERVEKLKER